MERTKTFEINHAALQFWKTHGSDEIFLMRRLEKHHRPTFLHSIRVAYYSYLVGQAMELSERDKEVLWKSALLHDIGKLMIPVELLNKKNRIEKEEWELLSQHCQYGVEIVRHCQVKHVETEVIMYHHEYLDGTGYYGLDEQQLQLFTRIVTVVDSFDVIKDAQALRYHNTLESAIEELYRWTEICFDPMIVHTFHHILMRTA